MNTHCQRCGRRSRSRRDILIDQLIQVQPVTKPLFHHDYSNQLQRVQQMIYLREQINKQE